MVEPSSTRRLREVYALLRLRRGGLATWGQGLCRILQSLYYLGLFLYSEVCTWKAHKYILQRNAFCSGTTDPLFSCRNRFGP